jgi:SET and MYND domain-containing protein 4
LYHQAQYDAALREIERAIKANYPKDMMYKLKERKARCLLAKKSLREALKAFQEDVQALDDSNLPHDRRMKLERDAQIMIKMLTKNMQMEEAVRKKQPTVAPAPKSKPKSPPVEYFFHEALTYDITEAEGRFVTAAQDIKLGAYLVQEKPHVSVLLQSYSQSHCQHCLKRANIHVACRHCADVIFCTEKCRDAAWSTYHQHECGVKQHLWNSGASITCQMALRAIAHKSLDYFLAIRVELDELRKAANYEKTDAYPNDDYRRVFSFVTHEAERTFEDVFHRLVMASFLTHCLKLGGFFAGDDSEAR